MNLEDFPDNATDEICPYLYEHDPRPLVTVGAEQTVYG